MNLKPPAVPEIAAGVVEGETITRYQPPPLGTRFTAARSYGNSNQNIVETVDELGTEFNGIKAFRTSTPDFYTYYAYDGGSLVAVLGRQGELEQVYFVRGSYIKFPVKPGDSWQYQWTKRLPTIDRTTANTAQMTAERWETVETTAGTFKTLKIHAKNLQGGQEWSIWYSPAIGRVVNYEGPLTLDDREHAVVTRLGEK